MGLLDAIGNACSAVADVVSDVADVAVSVATLDVGGVADGLGSLVGNLGDTFEAVTDCLGPLGSVVDDAIGALASGGGLGGILNSALDSLGLPDWIGDVAGGVLDFCTGNYVGAVANGLDALEDVAKACGGDEIAGFLKAGAGVTGMFSGGIGGDVGKIGEVLGGISGTISNVENAMGAASSLMDGDLVGAGGALLETFGPQLGELDSVLGPLSESATEILGAAREPATAILGALGDALEDGKLDFDDLLGPAAQLASEHLNFDPSVLFKGLSDAADSALGPHILKNPGALLESFGGAAASFLSQANKAAEMLQGGGLQVGGMTLEDFPLVDTLLGGVVDALAEQFGLSTEDLARIQDTIQISADLVNIATSDPDGLSILKDLLAQAPVAREKLETILHQGGTLRA
ncbi:hypothetical protein [Bradymonas sediminis]|uniref:hypothetical protein n=1 Tax=Bradymonas sediminis TaxID=1548548 RepID=UPI0010601692|nr:hypothetical protein [Bradymonas sediminis]TDP75446.1 hypothetical protein DFR33_104314 [Bradymonas sediminis]